MSLHVNRKQLPKFGLPVRSWFFVNIQKQDAKKFWKLFAKKEMLKYETWKWFWWLFLIITRQIAVLKWEKRLNFRCFVVLTSICKPFWKNIKNSTSKCRHFFLIPKKFVFRYKELEGVFSFIGNSMKN